MDVYVDIRVTETKQHLNASKIASVCIDDTIFVKPICLEQF